MDEAHEENEAAPRHHLGGRLVAFARRRPILSLGLLAGAAALGGVELAAGALIGLGAAALVATPDGRAFRDRFESATRRFFDRGDEQHPSRGDEHATPA